MWDYAIIVREDKADVMIARGAVDWPLLGLI